jgi:hypothetical protein
MTKLKVAFRNFANAPKNDVVSVAKISKWYFFTRSSSGWDQKWVQNFGRKSWTEETCCKNLAFKWEQNSIPDSGRRSLLRNVQTFREARPVSRVLSPGIQETGRVINHSTSTTAGVKNEWRYTSTPPIQVCLQTLDTEGVNWIDLAQDSVVAAFFTNRQ